MVQEQPPRRSKAANDPVTIDLTAEESEVVSQPVRSNDTDDAIKPDSSATAPADEAEARHYGQPAEDVFVAADVPDEAPPGNEAARAGHDLKQDGSADPARADAHAIAEDAPPTPEPGQPAGGYDAETAPRSSPETPARSGTSVSALVASGIFGGIVALLLAGSMQYAGYLPSATQPPREDSSALAAELDGLRQEVQALKQRPAGDPALAERLQALEQAQAAGPSGQVEQRLAALEDQIKQTRTATEATAGTQTEVLQRLGDAEAKLNDPGPEQEVARAVAAAALKAAIDRGGPFEPELATYANVAADDPAAAQLRAFAASGVPSRAELQRDFPSAADAMLEAVRQPDPNQGLAARLFSSAASVVKVRQVGQVEGTSPEAVVARIETALRNGDLATAEREWDALPEPAKAAGGQFKQKLDARLQVENLVGGTLTRAVAGTKG